MRNVISLGAMIALSFCLVAGAADEPKLTCPVSGKPASKDHAVAYKDGKAYFCCDNCPKAFEKNTKKFATKANMQLVETGQYKQVKCPLSGEGLNPETALKVAGVSVQFCCNNCKGKVADAKSDKKKISMVFADKAFDKAFEKASASDKASK
jgi:YHS domain-containing protein